MFNTTSELKTIILRFDVLKWATKKKTLTFHYTGCSIGIRIMVYSNPHITGEYAIPYIPGKTTRGPFFIAQVVGKESWLMVNPNLSPPSTTYPTLCTPREMPCPKIRLTNKKHRVNPMDLYLPKYWGKIWSLGHKYPKSSKITQNHPKLSKIIFKTLSKIIWVITCFHHPNWMKLLICPSLNAHKKHQGTETIFPTFSQWISGHLAGQLLNQLHQIQKVGNFQQLVMMFQEEG